MADLEIWGQYGEHDDAPDDDRTVKMEVHEVHALPTIGVVTVKLVEVLATEPSLSRIGFGSLVLTATEARDLHNGLAEALTKMEVPA